MHSELPGLAMNSHLASVGSSSASLGAASAPSTSSASRSSAKPRNILIPIPSLVLVERVVLTPSLQRRSPGPPQRLSRRGRPGRPPPQYLRGVAYTTKVAQRSLHYVRH